ncbi:N-acyl-L-homoserine lactone synthetase [Rhodobacterales bacterium HKCCE3408]|nr:N-acyl-L-homoserine lactone synthetase [Rhodobacterales bacterium HKCCE3408]
MQSTTLSFDNMHVHGELFTNMLRARHTTFIDQKSWDLPSADGMEFDQYDTPQSRWIAVHELGKVLAGVRLTPTTARCGMYSYMLRDAQRGLLDTIPDTLLWDEAPVAQHVWDANRMFVSRDVPASMRRQVQVQLITGMVTGARSLGASMLLGLLPTPVQRLATRVGLILENAGPIIDFAGIEHRCFTINLSTKLH